MAESLVIMVGLLVWSACIAGTAYWLGMRHPKKRLLVPVAKVVHQRTVPNLSRAERRAHKRRHR